MLRGGSAMRGDFVRLVAGVGCLVLSAVVVCAVVPLVALVIKKLSGFLMAVGRKIPCPR